MDIDNVFIAWSENFINGTVVRTIQGVFADEEMAWDFIQNENKKYGFYDYGVSGYTIRY